MDFLDRLDIEGTVLDALEEAPKFIRRNTRLAARIVTMRRQDIPEYPEIALREVLVNAVAHADYSLTGMRIRVAIYANRLEVENPGMLPFGMTLDDLKAGVSRIRNRVIVRVLRELGLVEEWGTGYRRVMQACEEGGYPPPVWQELGAIQVALLKINIEGGEYDLLERLLETGLVGQFQHLQVQFHRFVPDAEKRRDFIRTGLAHSHEERWCYPWVWESWTLK